MNVILPNKNKKLGILGDGQLAQMLVEAAFELGYDPLVYSSSKEHPASLKTSRIFLGEMKDAEKMSDFFSQVDLVAFENEFLDCELLGEASKNLSVQIYPRLPVIEHLQDKLNQKYLFKTLQMPSSDFVVLNGKDTATLAKLFRNFPEGFVLKWSRMGYDGKGVLILPAGSKAFDEISRFIELGFSRGAEVYAEEKINYVTELALVATRSISGKFVSYPLMISEQENGICKKVFGPAVAFGIPESLQKQATTLALKFANSLEMVGTFAMEFFFTREGDLLLNEVAPRVHNSGHITQDAFAPSQFENHWKALLDRDLSLKNKAPFFGMLNLLGPASAKIQNAKAPEFKEEKLFLHWYDKKELRAFRKMGHINGVADTKNELLEKMKLAQKLDEDWMKSFK
ncbi:MAG: ATP-grasp domain-containing protein [Deltaproteobacteria bacterium]|nr:ATP-grasp domain-containing protein [Deltaproteobacteria bacterium]